ncbi:MAG: outer membrane protein TolC [Candidatus Azotimanducaceae bacterium]
MNNKKETLAVLTMMLLSSATLKAGNDFFPDQMYLAYSHGEQAEDESSTFQQQMIAVVTSPSIELVDLVVEEDVVEVADENLGSEPEVAEIVDTSIAGSEMAEVGVSPKPGFFKRVGSSVSKMFSRDESVDVPDDTMEAETEIVVGDETDAIVEETYDIVSEVAEASEPEMKAEQEIADVVDVVDVVDAIEIVDIIDVADDRVMETSEKAPGIFRRMGDSVTNVFTFGDGKSEVRMNRGTSADLTLESLGAASDMFISADDESIALSVSKETLPLRDFVKLVAIKNDRIAYQKMEWAIAKSGVDSVSGIYEPELTASYQYTDSDTPNTTEEEFRRSFAPTFIERNHDYSLAVETVVPTGGRVRASYTYRDIENNIQPTPIRGEEEKNYFGLSVTQPLLRGAGWRGVESPLLVARKDQGIAKETFRQSLFQTVSDAVSVYWDVYMAEKRKELRVRSVEIAEGILVDEKERARFGRSGQANVLDAESALAQRRVQMLAADQNLFAVTGQLRNFIAGMPQDRKFKVDFSAMTEPGSIRFDRASMLANAYLYRPEYVAGLLRAEREDVRIQFAKNNKLPQLDLVASYGLNGLAESFGQSWDDVWDGDHESVYVGVEYRMALQGNKRGKGELSAARLRKHQALLEIKAAEIAIHNSVDTALNNLSSARMQVAELTGVVGTNKKLLDFELAKFEAGQSNSRDLFEIEERLNRVLELELESRVNLQKALIGAALSEGTLLQNFELEK